MLSEEDILALIFYSTEASELAKLLQEYSLYERGRTKEALRIAAAHWQEHGNPPGDLMSIYQHEDNKLHREIEALLPGIKSRWGFIEANLSVFKAEAGRTIEEEVARLKSMTELEALEYEGLDAYKRERDKPILSPFYTSPFLDLADTGAELFDTIDTSFSSGIEVFDRKRIIPQRGCYWLTLGLKGEGKTWRLIHFAKAALMMTQKVLFISIEMGPAQIRKRMLQSFFSLAAGERETHEVLQLHEFDERGRVVGSCAPNTFHTLSRPGLGNADEEFQESKRRMTSVQQDVRRQLEGYEFYNLINVRPARRLCIRGWQNRLKIVQHPPRTVTQSVIEQDLVKLKK